jgi:hypothetical protein
MYWYNPATRTSERVQAPSTDEQALVLVGHEFRLREPEHQLMLR